MAVLGVGLIGGSIGLAARTRSGAHVSGYDPDAGVRQRALELGVLDAAFEDVAGAVAGAEVVFVAAPVGVLEATVAEALAHAGGDCVVSDVGSTKRVLADAAAADERFIGGHPLAGAETAGVEHARGDLFEGATWYLTPARGSTAGVLYERLHALLRRFGARPVAIDAADHDRLMACVSHLPHVLANALVEQALALTAAGEEGEHAGAEAPAGEGGDGKGAGRPQRLPAVGPSFRDATRVAGANTAIWRDIYLSNRDALIAGIDELTARLGEARGALEAGDGEAIAAWNERARGAREALLGAGLTGGTGTDVAELRVGVPNRPGVIAEIALALGEAGVNILDLVLSPSEDNSRGVVALWIGGEQQARRAQELIGGLGFAVARG